MNNKIFLRTPIHPLSYLHEPDFESPEFQEAIYLSSPELYYQFKKFKKLTNKEQDKIKESLTKFWIRSCSRATPYGTFAGITSLSLSNLQSQVLIDLPQNHVKRVRLDMSYLSLVVKTLLSKKEIFEKLKFSPNNSIYEVGNEYRYAEYTDNINFKQYSLTAVEKTHYLETVLRSAEHGILFKDLINLLVDCLSVSKEEAEVYISNLRSSQLLVSDLELSVTGDEPLTALRQKLQEIIPDHSILRELNNIYNLTKNNRFTIENYQLIEQSLLELNLVEQLPKNFLQVDLYTSTKISLIEEELISEIIREVQDLKGLSREYKNQDLEEFKKRFYIKFEDQIIPLNIALDADLGVGYADFMDESTGGDIFIDSLRFRKPVDDLYEFDYVQQFTFKKYHDFITNSEKFIEITEDELKEFSSKIQNFNFPKSAFIFGSLMKKENTLDSLNFSFELFNFNGPSSANLLGRFAHGDEQLSNYIKQLLENEEKEDLNSIYAEIVHMPQPRSGNIILRPILRKYEIPYISASGIDNERQIFIHDLMVQVVNGDIILWSKRLNKRVRPRLTAAHNFSEQSLPIYKFLCDLQTHGLACASVWDWGQLNQLKFLPRVIYKNIIIQKASWKISEEDLIDLPDNKNQYVYFFKNFCSIRKLPVHIEYIEGDNILLLDLSDITEITILISYVRKYKKILVREFLLNSNNCIVHDESNKPYTSEIIIPITNNDTDYKRNAYKYSFANSCVQRTFTPGSEWLYFKLYCGSKTSDLLLSTKILEFIETGLSENLFEQFFFIRYKDDLPHIRIRFYNADISKQNYLFCEFTKYFNEEIKNGFINKIILDTYHRELERYDYELITFSEKIFHEDSLAILKFMRLLLGNDDNKYRMLFALRGIDMMLNDFGFSLNQKHSLINKLREASFFEFGAEPQLQKALNKKYSIKKHEIFSHLDPKNDHENEIGEAVYIFERRSIQNKIIIDRYLITLNNFEKESIYEKLLPSFLHMSINRLFITQQRKYELVIYHFLEKYYHSQLVLTSINSQKF